MPDALPWEQAAAGRIWFILNYQPIFDISADNGSQELSPQTILMREFGLYMATRVLDLLTFEFQSQAHHWRAIDLLPDEAYHMSSGRIPPTSEEVFIVLSRLSAALDALSISGLRHGTIGHNRGPSSQDAQLISSVKDATEKAKSGLAESSPDISKLRSARVHLNDALGAMGKSFAAESGKQIYTATTLGLIYLFSRLSDTVSALGHFLMR